MTNPPTQPGAKRNKHDWGSMEKGHSILFEGRFDAGSLLTCATSFSLRNKGGKWKFKSRKEQTGIRIFRIK